MPTLRRLCLLAVLAGSALLSAVDHPRLYFSASDIPALRNKITIEPWKSMYEQLLVDAEIQVRTESDGTATNDGRYYSSYRASKCAFLYVLTGDDAWAAKSKTYVQNVLAGAWNEQAPNGLNLYMHGKHVAQAYDFCYNAPSWAGFRDTISTELLNHANTVWSYNDGNSTVAASNWYAIRYASAGLCYLATDGVVPSNRLTDAGLRMKNYFDANFGTAPSPGWNVEGLGYTYYPMSFVAPFGAALKRAINYDIFASNPSVKNVPFTLVAANSFMRTVPINSPSGAGSIVGSHPDFSDDSNHTNSEGALGSGFIYCDPALLPGYAWMYDRMRGMGGDRSWDNDRAGTMYSILYHPGSSLTPANPFGNATWRALMSDTTGNGHFYFRNRYQDVSDLIVATNLKRRNPGGHGGPDGQSHRIIGFNRHFAMGGGKQPAAAKNRGQSTLYSVNPVTTAVTLGTAPGATLLSSTQHPDGSGTVTSHGTLTELKVNNHRRRMLTDFSSIPNGGVIVLADTSDNGLWWQQVCPLETPVTVTGNTFTMSGDGGTLKATIVYPAGATFDQWSATTGYNHQRNGLTDTGARGLVVNSADGDFIVVMTMVPNGTAHPAISTLAGTAVTDRRLQIGSLIVQVGVADIALATTSLPQVTITSTVANAAETGLVPGQFTISRSGSTAAALTVQLSVSGTASAGSDYTALPTSVVIPAGAASTTVAVTPIDDAVVESSETVTLTVSANANYDVGSPSTGTVTIADNDQVTVSIVASDATASEAGVQTGAFTLTRTGSTAAALTVQVTGSGTATSGSDFTALGSSVTIPAGSATAIVTVTPVDDSVVESAETVVLTVASGSGYAVGSPSAATVTIADNDLVTVSIEATDATASEAGVQTGTFTITRTGSTASALTVQLTGSGTATSGTDYTALGSSVTIPAGSSTATVTVTPVDDSTVESSETVVLTVASGSGYAVGSPSAATVTIADDDSVTVSIVASDATASEAGTQTGAFTISRTGSTAAALTVTMAAPTGTATSGSDYGVLPASVVIPAGSASVLMLLTPVNDALAEGDETVTWAIATSGAYIIGSPSSAAVVIADDDQPTVSIIQEDGTAAEAGAATGSVRISRTGPTTASLVVNLAAAGGTATSNADYQALPATVTIPAGSASVLLAITPIDDALLELSEAVVVQLASGSAYGLSAGTSASVTIADNDDLVLGSTLTLAPNPPVAGSSVTTTLSSNNQTGNTLQVTWTWGDGSSTSGASSASHVYAVGGSYTIAVTVVETATGKNAARTFPVTVQAAGGGAGPGAPTSVSTSGGSSGSCGLGSSLAALAALGLMLHSQRRRQG